MSINSILVIGAGTMGAGIAQVCLQAKKQVTLFDLDADKVSSAAAQIKTSLEKLQGSGKWGKDISIPDLLSGSFKSSSDSIGKHYDLAIEAIVEKADAKAALYARVEPALNEGGILTSNTSSLSITKLVKRLKNPGRFAGLHFFNPATHMPLVEVITADSTTGETAARLRDFVLEIGKTPVLASDSPGFIVNRVARPYYAEALHLHDRYGARLEDLDAAMENQGFRLGPFKLMDLIGHDVNYSVTSLVWEGLGKPDRFTPSPTQNNLVVNGLLGKKSGAGFYRY